MLRPYYDHNGIVIYHGDCLDVLPLLPANSVDFVLTDPPYLVNFVGRWDGKRTPIAGDDDPSWVRPAFNELWRVLKDDTFMVTTYGWPHAEIFVTALKEAGFWLVSHVVLVKRQWNYGSYTRGRHENALLAIKGRPAMPENPICDVIDWAREEHTFHPNQKPVASLTPLLDRFCPERGLVLDPFMGSGSTLRAAKDLGLSAIGIEIVEDYCRIAASRMAQEVLFPPDDRKVRSQDANLFPE